ncbi:MAG: transcription-repair coupling factor [Planctomycetota bacterium]
MPSPPSWLAPIAESAHPRALADAIASVDPAQAASTPVIADGSRGSSTSLLTGVLHQHLKRTLLLVVAHLDEADDALDDLERFPDLSVERFGALEVLPGESSINLELLAERLAVVERLGPTHQNRSCPDVIVAPVQALMQRVPGPKSVAEFSLTLKPGTEFPPGRLLDWLDRAGYTRQDGIEQPGDFAVRGGILDLYPVAGSSTDTAGTPRGAVPVRLDFFGDELDTLHRIGDDLLGSAEVLQSVNLIGGRPEALQQHNDLVSLLDLLPPDTVPVLHEVMELTEQARGYFERLTDPRGITGPDTLFQKLTRKPHLIVNAYASRAGSGSDHRVELPLEPLPGFDTDAKTAVRELADLTATGEVHVLCRKPAERQRLTELLTELAPDHAPGSADAVHLHDGAIHRGFVWKHDTPISPRLCRGARGEPDVSRDTDNPDDPFPETRKATRRRTSPPAHPDEPGPHAKPLIVVPHHELFHRFETRRRVRRVTAGQQANDAFLDLDVGDVVVHVDHGIARFTGLKTMRRKGQAEEYLTLQFAQKALLHVPAAQIDLIQRYVGGFEGRPPLSILGGKTWNRQKQQVAEAVKDMAAELLRVQAARATQPGIRYPADTAWQHEFEAEFPYDETDDQLAAIAAIKQDMSGEQPMDRLICGDVGFGKTEVAIRAAFKAAEFGKQVAVLVPTTVLAEQHERTFRGRFADYPFTVASLSRFKTGKEAKKTLEDVSKGRVDILVGTHRLLSDDVRFADLGMVIIDEEQRFGVEHKNKLLSFRLTADVLTLTATPIPRTLHMSMIGLRDISSLSTAPVDRRAIVTEVVPYDNARIKQALQRELARDGQVYFVHNRVHNIQTVADDLQQLAPDAKILIGHGQMPPRKLEEVMLAFIRREADILVSTTIIESGIDIPTANTMFINQSDHFGLAELHQLRGRVGRSKHRAYCYMLLPPDRSVNEVAAKRLKAIENYSMLGAGFKIAMRDLELRGAGNLLGAEQSGHIAAVGYEMYCVLLEQATKRLKNEALIEPAKTHLELGIAGTLPKRYIPSDKHRMDAYRRLTRADTLDALAEVVSDLTDAYGKPPDAAQRFLDLQEIRVAASTLGIALLKRETPDLIFQAQPPATATTLTPLFNTAPGRATELDGTTVYWRPPVNYLDDDATILAVLRKLLVRPLTRPASPANTPRATAVP